MVPSMSKFVRSWFFCSGENMACVRTDRFPLLIRLSGGSRGRVGRKRKDRVSPFVFHPIMQPDSFLVIGGSGFLGRHIIDALLARGDAVAVFDIVQRYHDTPFYPGDISDQAQVSDAIKKVFSFSYHFAFF